MNTFELYQLAMSDDILSRVFAGVFAADQLPMKINKKHKGFISNLDTSDKRGSHWVAMYFDNKKCYYFDSYGMKCRSRHILKFIKKNSTSIEWNDVVYQSPFSRSCALYCFYFLSHIVRRKKLHELTSNKDVNEKIVCSYVAKQVIYPNILHIGAIQDCNSLL